MAVVLIVVATCSAGGLTGGGCGGDDTADRPPSELVGVIVDLDEPGGRVSSFTLRNGGRTYEVFVAADVDYGFDLRHLREHREGGDPVRCRLEDRGGRLYALAIADA